MRTLSPLSATRRVRMAAVLAAAASLAVLGPQAAAAAGPDAGLRTAGAPTAEAGPLLTGQVFQNTEDFFIPELAPAITSPIEVTGLSGNAPADLAVTVDIEHDARGDLVIDLVAPDGTVHSLKEDLAFDFTPYVEQTYTVDASSEAANGTWQLSVRDVWGYPFHYEGHLCGWQLDF